MAFRLKDSLMTTWRIVESAVALVIMAVLVNSLTAAICVRWLYLLLQVLTCHVWEKSQRPVALQQCECLSWCVCMYGCVCVCSFDTKHFYKSVKSHVWKRLLPAAQLLIFMPSPTLSFNPTHLPPLTPPSRLSQMTQCLGLFSGSIPVNRISFNLSVILTLCSIVIITLIYFPSDTHYLEFVVQFEWHITGRLQENGI